MKTVKKYKWAMLVVACVYGLYLYQPNIALNTLSVAFSDAKIILSILPPVLILVGLLDVWVPKETVIRYMGGDSGIKGLLFAFFLGAIAAGPLFMAFPIAAMLAGKGARLANILFFIGIWTSVKLPMLLFEYTFFKGTFTTIHAVVNIIVFLLGSFLIEKMATEDSIKRLRSMDIS